MNPEQLNPKELPFIQKIISDEVWLEGERRGCAVNSGDAAIQLKVAEIVLNEVGEILRKEFDR
jgi:hypothetical protein